MKTLYTINNFILISLGIVLLITIVDNSFGMLFVLGLIPLGFFQSITGIILFLSNAKNRGFQLYVGGLVLVIVLINVPSEWSWMIPPIPMALYFTFLLHTLKTKPQKI